MGDETMPVTHTFRFEWKDGSANEGIGFGDGAAGAADALNRLGFGQGAVAALDRWYPVADRVPASGSPPK